MVPQWIKQSNFYTQEVLEGRTIKRENYSKVLSRFTTEKLVVHNPSLCYVKCVPLPHSRGIDFKVGDVHNHSKSFQLFFFFFPQTCTWEKSH